MNVRIETDGDLCVAAPEGRIDAVSADELQQQLDTQLNTVAKRMVIDLSAVDYISSAGLRVFLKVAKRLPGKVAVCGLNANVKQIFDLAGFDSILKVCASRQEGVAGIGA